MTSKDPTYRIDPIEPDQVRLRFLALLERLEPVLVEDDVALLRRQVEAGENVVAYARLDAITDDGTVTVDTAILVELVLLGQAIRAG